MRFIWEQVLDVNHRISNLLIDICVGCFAMGGASSRKLATETNDLLKYYDFWECVLL